MADIKLNDLSVATDLAYAYIEQANGAQGKISKTQLASLVATATNSLNVVDGVQNVDIDNVTLTGTYFIPANTTNSPVYSNGILIVLKHVLPSWGKNFVTQMFIPQYTTSLYCRTKDGESEWSPWAVNDSLEDLKSLAATNNVDYVYGETSEGTQCKVSAYDLLDVQTALLQPTESCNFTYRVYGMYVITENAWLGESAIISIGYNATDNPTRSGVTIISDTSGFLSTKITFSKRAGGSGTITFTNIHNTTVGIYFSKL